MASPGPLDGRARRLRRPRTARRSPLDAARSGASAAARPAPQWPCHQTVPWRRIRRPNLLIGRRGVGPGPNPHNKHAAELLINGRPCHLDSSAGARASHAPGRHRAGRGGPTKALPLAGAGGAPEFKGGNESGDSFHLPSDSMEHLNCKRASASCDRRARRRCCHRVRSPNRAQLKASKVLLGRLELAPGISELVGAARPATSHQVATWQLPITPARHGRRKYKAADKDGPAPEAPLGPKVISARRSWRPVSI